MRLENNDKSAAGLNIGIGSLNFIEKMWTMIAGLSILVQTIALALMGWLLIQVVELGKDMSAVKATAMTIQNGNDMEKRISSELLSIWKQISVVRQDLNSPPEHR